ncbi:transcriptional repressor TraM [Bradyrhizobium sp. 31Argb]|uniref:transcriptional repressor TraM n=1 Tax=Bradyrhizobium sp. 31Argb TaxID=3141247 RepID=UPI00374A1477
MASNNDDESPGAGFTCNLEHVFREMAQPELERLTIDAIREYRASVALAETARLQRVAAEAYTDSYPARRAELQRIHEHAETEHRARQLVLNNLIDRLGYIPKVPAG